MYTFPDIVLSKRSLPLERIDRSLYKLAEDMLETMYEAPGIGLAANQVGILKRIIVLDVEYEHDDDQIILNRKPQVMINPILEKHEGEILYSEGCLSVPGFNCKVKRFEKVWVRYHDIDGRERRIVTDGLQAVCLQHEMDHLNGRLFIDKLSSAKKAATKQKLRKARREQEDG